MPIKGILGGAGVKPLGYGLGVEAEEKDPNFNQTVLLLHADGSEGEGNTSALGDPNYKAFRDNSTSAHAIVVNGDAYGNDFSPYYYADGYWSIATNTAGNISLGSRVFSNLSGDKSWTIEGWIYYPDSGNAYTNLIGAYTIGQVNSTAIFLRGSGQSYEPSSISLATYGGSNITFLNPGSNSIPHSQWFHFAFVRDSSNGNGYCFINGVLEQTVSFSATSFYDVDNTMNGGSNIASHNMYISNFRIVDGTAVYTSAFTPSTAPLTAITNTTFLMGQSNRFIDNSSSPVTITPNSSGAKISTNTPFTQSKTANVGSGFFDGTGDELEITNSSDFAFGTGDFQISLWVYLLENSGGLVGLTGGTATGYWCLTANSGTLYFQKAHNAADVFSTTLPSLHAWHFIEVSRVSSTTKMFIDGVQTNTASDTTDYNQTGQTLDIGDHGNHGEPKGYIADVRIIKGSGVTSSTLPTTSLTAVTNTKFLACQYSGAVRNVGFVDDSKYNHRITRNGHVHMGTFSPFSLEDGYWSRYTQANSSADTHGTGITLGTNNFTIGMFVYPLGCDNVIGQALTAGGHSRTALYADTGTASVIIAHDQLLVAAPSTWSVQIDYTTDIALNQWQWIQVDRTGNTFRVSINGSYVDGGGATASGSVPAIVTGTFGQRAGQDNYLGYFSNFILINGANRGSIATPTSPLTADSDTALLLHQSNRYVNNGNTSVTLTSGGDNKILPFSPLAPSRSYSKDAVGGSAYFDGTDDYIHATLPFGIGTLDMTVEFWYYPTVFGNYLAPFAVNASGSRGEGFNVGSDENGKLKFVDTDGTNYESGNNQLQLNSWNHIAVVRDGSTVRVFHNGTQIGTVSNSENWTGTIIAVGARADDFSEEITGYISNCNLVIGTAKYDASGYTIPSTQITAHANTQFLVNFTNAGIIDHTMKNNLDTVNNVRIRTNVKKFGTGSIYFDGTDSVRWNQTSDTYEGMAIGTGPFTVEFFVYFDGDPNNGGTNGQASLIRDAGGNLVIQRYNGEWEAGNESVPQIQVAQSLSNQTWYHVAMTRDSSANLKLFIDGTQAGSTATSHTTNFSKNEWHLGALNADASGGRTLTGFMDEIRITVGVARYTTNFTAPTQAFANR